MVQIADLLEECHTLHSDYPKIAAHQDNQSNILCSALHDNIDPNRNNSEAAQKIDLVRTALKELHGKCFDSFLSDSIHSYKMHSDNGTEKNPSYLLVSKCSKRQQNSQCDLTASKRVAVSTDDKVSGSPRNDILLINGGFFNFLLLKFSF
jgi:hypothetical protein